MVAVAEQLFGESEPVADDLLSCIEAAIEGDYMRIPAGTDPLSHAVARLIEKVQRQTSATLTDVVAVSVGVNETAVMSANLLYNFRQVDEEAQAIATAADEMVVTVREIADRGQEAARKARAAEQACASSKAALSQTGERMRTINVAVTDTNERIGSIQELSSRISDIATGIKKIASQTNMLAINAAVEAARAGDAGRGFAVVASEVKALSDRTAAATVEIGDIISKLHSGLGAMVTSMNLSRTSVTEGTQAVETLQSTLASAAVMIDEAVGNVDQIAVALEQQRASAQSVAAGIATVAGNSTKSTRDLERVIGAMDMAQSSLNKQLQQLASCTLPGKIIKLAQSDHVIWKKRLADMMIGREGLRVEELADHRNCRLGKWYQSMRGTVAGQSPAFIALDDPHCRVHQHGIDAVRLYNKGDIAGALSELACVEVASNEVLVQLRLLERTGDA